MLFASEKRQVDKVRMDGTPMTEEDLLNMPKEGERYPGGWNEDTWEQEFEEHPMFMTKPSADGSLPPLMQAIQQIKYDPESNTKKELAANYKEDGNQNFKLKKYRWAVASYTEGLKINCEDNELNSVLYGNRAASHTFLGNHRSALNDSLKSFNLNENNHKAMVRAAQCYNQLKKFEECIAFCTKHGAKSPKLADVCLAAQTELGKLTEEAKREKAVQNALDTKKALIAGAIEERNINVKGSVFQSSHPGASHIHVNLNEANQLVWPVIFLYPDHNQTDFIEQFNENESFAAYFDVLFGDENNLPPWDIDRIYRPDKLEIAYSFPGMEVLCRIDPKKPLKDVLSSSDFVLLGANPTFVVTSGELSAY